MSSSFQFETIADYVENETFIRANPDHLGVVAIRSIYDYVARDIAPRWKPIVVRQLLYLLRFTVGFGKEYFAQGAHRCAKGRPSTGGKLIAPPNGASPRTTQRVNAIIVEEGWFCCEGEGRSGGRANIYRPSEAFLAMATAKRDDVIYGDLNALTVAREYERLIDKGSHLTATEFACALWSVYAMRSTALMSSKGWKRYGSWADLATGKRSDDGRLIFPAINLGRTAMKKAFHELDQAGFLNINYCAGRPSIFELPACETALENIRRESRSSPDAVQEDGASTRPSAVVHSRKVDQVDHLVENRALNEMRRASELTWLCHVWRAAVRKRSPEYEEYITLPTEDDRNCARAILHHMRERRIRAEIDQRRFLLFAAARSPDPQWNRIGHLNRRVLIDRLIAQFRAEHTQQTA
ncbi:hypothetical protein [Burkholderia pseudomallei]|uniref:hypothetical protein n=3 Tax=Burkholderia pseudomallei TaxID=28450 RepID=UPI0013158873|nr:hypothetical protein [Burkholderia pseudomallei]CAJ3950519.1 Uncharacterised protein [Burkholderia pseudomallei]CAJ4250354.1 Uncharacterised protein [Burkholderia pseudomallei]CAJ8572351.1 Uncharacterised protein [Burkholderia pseudomallei]